MPLEIHPRFPGIFLRISSALLKALIMWFMSLSFNITLALPFHHWIHVIKRRVSTKSSISHLTISTVFLLLYIFATQSLCGKNTYYRENVQSLQVRHNITVVLVLLKVPGCRQGELWMTFWSIVDNYYIDISLDLRSLRGLCCLLEFKS